MDLVKPPPFNHTYRISGALGSDWSDCVVSGHSEGNETVVFWDIGFSTWANTKPHVIINAIAKLAAEIRLLHKHDQGAQKSGKLWP